MVTASLDSNESKYNDVGVNQEIHIFERALRFKYSHTTIKSYIEIACKMRVTKKLKKLKRNLNKTQLGAHHLIVFREKNIIHQRVQKYYPAD